MNLPRVDFVAQEGDQLLLRIDTDVYGEDPVLRALHTFTARCYVHAERLDDRTLLCRFRAKREGDTLDAVVGAFANEVLDHTLRQRLRAETEPVRRLIIAQAFSQVDLRKPHLDSDDPREDPQGVTRPDSDPRLDGDDRGSASDRDQDGH